MSPFRFNKYFRRTRAASMMETALLVSLVCLIAITAVSLTGKQVACSLERMTNQFGHDGTAACELLADALAPDLSDPNDVGVGNPDDDVPDPVIFTDAYNSDLDEGQFVLSNAPRVKNMRGGLPVSVYTVDGGQLASAGNGSPIVGEVSINGGGWARSGVVYPGERVRLRVKAPAQSSKVTLLVSIGSISSTWTVATRPKDITPDLNLVNLEDVASGSVQSTGWMRLSGFDDPLELRVEGPGARLWINGNEEPTLSRTIHPGDFGFFQVQAPSQACDGSSTLSFFGDGKPFANWAVSLPSCNSPTNPGTGPGVPSPGAPTSPGQLVFSALKNLDPKVVVESNQVTVPADIVEPVALTLSTGNSAAVSVNGSAWSADAVVRAGDHLRLRALSPEIPGRSETVFVGIGPMLANWSLTTKPGYPMPVVFSPVPGAEPASRVSSSIAVMSPFHGTIRASVGPASTSAPGVAAPELWVNGLMISSGETDLRSGDEVQIVRDTPAIFATDVSSVLRMTGMADSVWKLSTRNSIQAPPALDVGAVNGAEPSETIFSDVMTIGPFEGQVEITIAGAGDPALSINGGPYSASGLIRAGDTVQFRATSSSEYASAVSLSIKIGASSSSWSIKTRAADILPDSFTFAPVRDANTDQELVSSPVTVSGIEIPVDVTVAGPGDGARISVNSGAWVSSSVVGNGDIVRIRATSPARLNQEATFWITIGTGTSPWTISTRAGFLGFQDLDKQEPASTVTSNTITLNSLPAPQEFILSGDSSGVFLLNGIDAGRTALVGNGDKLALMVRSSSSFDAEVALRITAAGDPTMDSAWTVRTRPKIVRPVLSYLPPITQTEPNTLVVSSASTVTGIDGTITLTVSGGEIALASATPAFGSQITVQSGSSFLLRTRSSMSFDGISAVTLRVTEDPEYAAGWTVTTRSRDTLADPITLPDRFDAPVGSVVMSEAVMISGFDGILDVGISVDSPDARDVEFRTDGGAWRTNGSISAGQSLEVRFRTSNAVDEVYTSSIRIGDAVVGSWLVVTGPDRFPDQVSFPSMDNVSLDILVTSPKVSISGLAVPVTATVSLGENDDTVLVHNGIVLAVKSVQVFNGDTLAIRARSASGYNQSRTANLEIGPAFVTSWSIRTHSSDKSPPSWITAATLPVANVGVAASIQLQASDDGAVVRYEQGLGNLPPGLSLNSATGVVSGTPSQIGEYHFEVLALDNDALTMPRFFSMVIADGPAWQTSENLGVAARDRALSMPLLAASKNGGTISYAKISGDLPAGTNLVAGAVSGTPTASGTYSFTVRATGQSGAFSDRTFSLTIEEAPVWITEPLLPNALNDVAYSVELKASDAENGALTYSLAPGSSSLPAGFTLSEQGVLSGTSNQSNSIIFTARVTDPTGFFTDRAFTLPTTIASSCKAIKEASPNTPSGQYRLQSSTGSPTTYTVYCDMQTDGGGWLLVLNYLHKGGTNPAVNARTTSFPLPGSNVLGTNESSNQSTWGHAAPVLLSSVDFAETRFYCKSSTHNRVLHFKSSQKNLADYFKTGQGQAIIPISHTALPGHTAFLPGSAAAAFKDQGTSAMLSFPFYKAGVNHWSIGGLARWECDDYPNNSSASTYHQIWVR